MTYNTTEKTGPTKQIRKYNNTISFVKPYSLTGPLAAVEYFYEPVVTSYCNDTSKEQLKSPEITTLQEANHIYQTIT